jgi:hypothetical protein
MLGFIIFDIQKLTTSKRAETLIFQGFSCVSCGRKERLNCCERISDFRNQLIVSRLGRS